MEAIAPRREQLPAKPEELHKWLLIGKQVLKAQKAKLRAIQDAETAQTAKDAALADTQDMAEILLDAEVRFGEVLAAIDKRPSRRSSRQGTSLRALPDGVTKKESHEAQKLKEHRDIVEHCKAQAREKGDIVTARMVSKAIKEADREEKKREKEEAAKREQGRIARAKLAKVCDIRHCSMEDLLLQVKPDCIITDPPYPEEFVYLYGELARLSQSVGLVAAMCGQSYLPEVLALMTSHLRYRWTLAYLTPGGQAVQQWPCKVNTFWKPVLLFGSAVDWIGDVCRSDVNDNDKQHHDWGQSESGMADLVERLSEPGQLVCDPFCGGGTTAVVCLRLGRRFVGCDIDSECVETAWRRCEVEHGCL